MFRRGSLLAITVLGSLGFAFGARATDFSSPHFTVRDPLTTDGSSYSSSEHFSSYSSTGETAIGEGTSPSFTGQAGSQSSADVDAPADDGDDGDENSGGGGDGGGGGGAGAVASPKSELPAVTVGCPHSDVNCDAVVNLTDFSIVAYWYDRPLSAEFAAIETASLSGDGIIDLVDFSILAYWWTG